MCGASSMGAYSPNGLADFVPIIPICSPVVLLLVMLRPRKERGLLVPPSLERVPLSSYAPLLFFLSCPCRAFFWYIRSQFSFPIPAIDPPIALQPLSVFVPPHFVSNPIRCFFNAFSMPRARASFYFCSRRRAISILSQPPA